LTADIPFKHTNSTGEMLSPSELLTANPKERGFPLDDHLHQFACHLTAGDCGSGPSQPGFQVELLQPADALTPDVTPELDGFSRRNC
jgi:hypothetical protein